MPCFALQRFHLRPLYAQLRFFIGFWSMELLDGFPIRSEKTAFAPVFRATPRQESSRAVKRTRWAFWFVGWIDPLKVPALRGNPSKPELPQLYSLNRKVDQFFLNGW